jgi:hypothetical protein
MKKLLFMFLFCYSLAASSYEGVIIVVEALLLKFPKENAKVLQVARKGEKIIVPTSLNLNQALPEYIQTYDRTGNVAYIRSHHIKIITNDEREGQWPISIGDNDPTDYRIEEPIQPTYPFLDHEFGRVSIDITLASNPFSPYSYGSSTTAQNYTYEKGMRFAITKKLTLDKDNRFYFGVLVGVASVNNNITFSNGNLSQESRSLLRAGPLFTYDAFRNTHFRFSVGAGISYNYHKTSISIVDTQGNGDERLFSGYSLAPFSTIGLEYDNIIPGFDLVSGSDMFLYLPYSQTAPKSSGSAINWTEDRIQTAARAQVTFFIGVQTKY